MIETPHDRLIILETHLQFLSAKKDRLFAKLGEGPHPEVETVLTQILDTESLRQRTLEAINNPKGHRVRVLKSRLIQEGAIGLVKYVYKDKPCVVVVFPGLEKPVSLAKDNIEIVDLWPLPPWIPAPGMKVRAYFIDNPLRTVLEWKFDAAVVRTETGAVTEISRQSMVEVNGQPV